MEEKFWEEIIAWLVAALLAIATVFSNKIAERIRFALNRADLRVKQFEEMALDLSDFVFQAQLQHEFISAGWDTAQEVGPVTKHYNAAITTLRRKEFVYRSWVRRYWQDRTWVRRYWQDRSENEFNSLIDPVNEFNSLIDTVKRIDKVVHVLNNLDDLKRRPEELKEKLNDLKTLNDEQRARVEKWLSKADA